MTDLPQPNAYVLGNPVAAPSFSSTDHSTLPDISSARLPQSYESAKTALAECQKIDECKTWADKSAALASYAKQAGDDALEKMSLRIRARAIRKCGDLLEQINPSHGANQNITEGRHPKVRSRKEAAVEAGLSEHQQKTAQRVAKVPEDQFERAIEADKPATITELAEAGTQKQPPKNIVDLQGRDPKEYNRAIHFTALINRYSDDLQGYHDEQWPKLNEEDVETIADAMSQIIWLHESLSRHLFEFGFGDMIYDPYRK